MKTKTFTHPEGHIVLIDDDESEEALFKHALKKLNVKNKLKFFEGGEKAYQYLKQTQDDIFVIISDLKMPRMDGLELKRVIDGTPELIIKSIPFFFHSNSGSAEEIKAAYSLGIQGFIRKANDLEGTTCVLKCIIDLWTVCLHPSDIRKGIIKDNKCDFN